MSLNVKNKIRLGSVFLFILLSGIGAIGIYYLVKIKTESKEILKDNYESLAYVHSMQQDMYSPGQNRMASLQDFDHSLKLQENNITEPGEDTATHHVREGFNKLKRGDSSRSNMEEITKGLQVILHLNMKAIKMKNAKAESTADKALTLLLFISGIVFLIAFTFVFNFPSIITNPIHSLTDAIKEIANKNYRHRIHIKNKDEFGQLADAFNQMAERLEFFENSNLNKLMFEKNRAEGVINSLKDASIGIDKNEMILFANFQAIQLLGLKLEEVIGQYVKDLKKKNDLFKFLVENESTTPFKIVMDNRENYFVKEVVEVTQGDRGNKVIVLKNITSYKELDEAKTNFIATISHELKTPLASSDFGLKLLEDPRIGSLTSEQKELVEKLKKDNQRMLRILSELLNMSQVETGKIQLNLTGVSAEQIIQNSLNTVSGSAKSKGISIFYAADKNIPLLYADLDKTTWVLNNLLVNAIKYSPDNSTITIETIVKDNFLTFSVRDNGIGIAPEYLNKLFDRYFQVPGNPFKGTGLGLSISKEFIEAQNGKIWVESILKEGSVFSFQLPIIKNAN